MKNYNRNDKFDRERGFRKGRGKDSGKSLMHKTTCDYCGKACEVPFKPTSSKPVFCNICFERNQSEDSRRSHRERDVRKFTGRDSRDHNREKHTELLKKELEAINKKLDKILNTLTLVLSTKKDPEKSEEEAEDKKPAKKTRKAAASKTAAKKPAAVKSKGDGS